MELQSLLKSLIKNEITADGIESEWTPQQDKAMLYAGLYNLDKELKVEALRKVLSKRYEYYMNKLIDAENAEELLPTLKKIKEMKKADEEKYDECLKSNYAFITIAPVNNSVKPLELIKYCDNFCKKKFVKQYIFVLEQRYDGIPNEKYKNIGEGLHAHILMDKGDYKHSHLKRDMDRIFHNLDSNNHISYRWERDVMKTQNYLLGQKNDPLKHLKQQQDKIFREQQDVREYYGEKFEIL